MSRYPAGQPVRVSTTVHDVTGTLVNATALTLVVKLQAADGTLTTTGTYSSPVNDSTGLYHQDIPAADLAGLGHYQYVWTATGTGAGVTPPAGFDVYDPFEAAILPLQDGKDQLNIPQTVTTYDAELQSWIATIETSMEAFTGGPLLNRSVTERGELDGTATVLIAQQRPILSAASVISITPLDSGVPADLSMGVDLDPGAGIIRAKPGLRFAGIWNAPVTLVYVPGWGTSVPAAFNSVARLVLQHLWDTQHGPSVRPSMGGQELTVVSGFGFAIPNRAAELLNGQLNGIPFRAAPGVFA